ncbi:MAG: hypothetical protein K2X66_13320, partial [Cyanobacteria bacterium]|nr:hypothetical protein [Cyanobacteriota bacterium]
DNNITPVNGGVDFTGNGLVDVPTSQLTSGGGNLNTTRQVTGTSFAAPRALADDLAGRTRFTA